MYEIELKSPTAEKFISAVDDLLTNGIQALKHWWKKCVDWKCVGG